MKRPAPSIHQIAAVTVAVLAGVAEFASLQRWRLRAWLTR